MLNLPTLFISVRTIMCCTAHYMSNCQNSTLVQVFELFGISFSTMLIMPSPPPDESRKQLVQKATSKSSIRYRKKLHDARLPIGATLITQYSAQTTWLHSNRYLTDCGLMPEIWTNNQSTKDSSAVHCSPLIKLTTNHQPQENATRFKYLVSTQLHGPAT